MWPKLLLASSSDPAGLNQTPVARVDAVCGPDVYGALPRDTKINSTSFTARRGATKRGLSRNFTSRNNEHNVTGSSTAKQAALVALLDPSTHCRAPLALTHTRHH